MHGTFTYTPDTCMVYPRSRNSFYFVTIDKLLLFSKREIERATHEVITLALMMQIYGSMSNSVQTDQLHFYGMHGQMHNTAFLSSHEMEFAVKYSAHEHLAATSASVYRVSLFG